MPRPNAAPVLGASQRFDWGPWLWRPQRDLWTFGGSALAALACVALGHAFGFGGGALPEWAFLAFVLGVDVAHVYATLFRTYFDRAEIRAHKLRYLGIPSAAYVCGLALYSAGPLAFWRALAYLAVFHFIRQEIGWLRLYRSRAAGGSRFDARLAEVCVYASTLYPLLYWHAHAETRHFSWFVSGDFVRFGSFAARLVPPVKWAAWSLFVAFVLRQLWLAYRQRALCLGYSLIVSKTAAIWYVGIVLTSSDFDFTVTNVIAHGVPYFVLLWSYARERYRQAPKSVASELVRGGIGVFLAVLFGLAFVEEFVWDSLVWHDHPGLFGSGLELGGWALRVLVPLLAVPQITHYVLDGLLWRRRESVRLPAQRRALGFVGATEAVT